ncbi:hypothetical protein AAC387_Pa08g0531 [Persea americana]
MDTDQWPQEVGLVKPMENMVSTTCSKPLTEKRTRPPKDQALNCPRRYWTEGGTLRNVPVGGGTRKNKRSSSSASTNSKKIPDLTPSNSSHSPSQNTRIHEVQDLNLAFRTTPDYNNMSGFVELQGSENNNPSSTSFSELLRSGISSRGLNPFMPMPMLDPNITYPSGFGLNELRPTFNFPLDGVIGGYGNIQGLNEGSGNLTFPLEDVKPVPSTDFEQHRGQGDDASGGYWNGMLGGGPW